MRAMITIENHRSVRLFSIQKNTPTHVFCYLFLFVSSKFWRCRTLNGAYVYIHDFACFCVDLHLNFIDVADVNFHFVNVYRMFEIA